MQLGTTPLVHVLGVDPTRPDVVFMSSLAANPPAGDRLYRSTDGGMTWTEVLAPSGAIVDLAIARAGIVVATLGGGAFFSGDGGATFSPMAAAPQLACVGQGDDGELYGCGANWQPDFKAVAKSADGASWDKVFRFVELAGPVECAPGTPQHDTCGGLWPALQAQFGSTGASSCVPLYDDTPPRKPSTGGCCDAGDGAPGQLVALGLLAAACGLVILRRRPR